MKAPRCPICKKIVEPDSSTFPFCSSRCRTIDLARWLDESYSLSEPNLEEEQEFPEGFDIERE